MKMDAPPEASWHCHDGRSQHRRGRASYLLESRAAPLLDLIFVKRHDAIRSHFITHSTHHALAIKRSGGVGEAPAGESVLRIRTSEERPLVRQQRRISGGAAPGQLALAEVLPPLT